MKIQFRILFLALVAGFFYSSVAAAASVPVRIYVHPEQAVLPSSGLSRTVLQILVEGARSSVVRERAPLNLALVLDTSGSMQGERIAHARRAALEVVGRLDRDDVFSLITYDSEARVVIPAGPVEDRAAMERIIRGLGAGGMTALYAGVEAGAKELSRYHSGNYVSRMILVSDGIANIGPSRPEHLAGLGQRLAKQGITLSSLGVGMGYNEDLMTQLAARSGGNAYFVEAAADLVRIVDREMGQALSLLAQAVDIRIELPVGLRPTRIIGVEGVIQGRQVEVSLPPLYSGQQRYVLLEVEASPESAGLTLDKASARLQLPGQGGHVRLEAPAVSLHFSGEPDRVEQSLNREVQRARLLDEAAAARAQAITLQDAGQRAAAAEVLAEAASRVAAAPAARVGDVALAEQISALKLESETVRSRALSNAERKSMRASSFEQLNRQQVEK